MTLLSFVHEEMVMELNQTDLQRAYLFLTAPVDFEDKLTVGRATMKKSVPGVVRVISHHSFDERPGYEQVPMSERTDKKTYRPYRDDPLEESQLQCQGWVAPVVGEEEEEREAGEADQQTPMGTKEEREGWIYPQDKQKSFAKFIYMCGDWVVFCFGGLKGFSFNRKILFANNQVHFMAMDTCAKTFSLIMAYDMDKYCIAAYKRRKERRRVAAAKRLANKAETEAEGEAKAETEQGHSKSHGRKRKVAESHCDEAEGPNTKKKKRFC